MATKTNTIGYSVIAGLAMLLTLGGSVVYNSFQPDTYYCQATNTVMKCTGFSTYYQLDTGKCLNAEIGNKLCRTGWVAIENNQVIEPVSQQNAGQWLCSPENCVPIS